MKRVRRNYLPFLLILLACALGYYLYAQRQLGPFIPPDSDARAKAVGDLEASELTVFDPNSDAFKPIPKPAPGDWLANHREPGQTFRQFLKSKSNRPDRTRSILYILPLGEFEPSDADTLLEPLREYSELYFGMSTKLLPTEGDTKKLGITTRINAGTGKRQLLSTDILDLLPKKLPADAFCMLAITKEDLYPEESWNFVFGQASLRNRVGVFSFARYDPTFLGGETIPDLDKLVLKRSCDVLVHETGHMFGIQHCIHFHCIMNGSNNLEESDAAPMHLGPSCLRKLHSSTGFAIADRYSKLSKFYAKHGFEEEREWATQRAAAVR